MTTMNIWLLALASYWGPLLGLIALPFLLSAGVLCFNQLRGRNRLPGAALPDSAGRWLEREAARRAPEVEIQIHDQEGLDAYWPGVGAIGLSESTWSSRDVTAWAVAAHELGHALSVRRHPVLDTVLPVARLLTEAAWRGFAASLLVSALLGSAWMLDLARWFAAGAVLIGAVVLADEALANRQGWQILGQQRALSRDHLLRAGTHMAEGFSVYAAIWTGQLLALFAWPAVSLHVEPAGVAVATTPSAAGLWLLFVLIPVLGLRAAYVVNQVWRPEPVASDFRLFSVMQREAQWEFLTGLSVLAIVCALYDHASGPIFVLSVTLAAMTAIGPVAAVGRALVLFPVLVVLRRYTERRQSDDERLFPETRPDGGCPALMALFNNPPWYLRVSWLTNLAYLPMIVVLVAQVAFAGP